MNDDRVEVGNEYCKASDDAGQLMDAVDNYGDPGLDPDRLATQVRLFSETGVWYTAGVLDMDPRDVILAWKLVEVMMAS